MDGIGLAGEGSDICQMQPVGTAFVESGGSINDIAAVSGCKGSFHEAETIQRYRIFGCIQARTVLH